MNYKKKILVFSKFLKAYLKELLKSMFQKIIKIYFRELLKNKYQYISINF